MPRPSGGRCASQGKRRKFIIIEEQPRTIPRRGWAEMIRKVYKVDPLVCPKCVENPEESTCRVYTLEEKQKAFSYLGNSKTS